MPSFFKSDSLLDGPLFGGLTSDVSNSVDAAAESSLFRKLTTDEAATVDGVASKYSFFVSKIINHLISSTPSTSFL